MRYIVIVTLGLVIMACMLVSMGKKEGFSEAKATTKGKGIALLMRKPVDLPLWLKHHREMGISKFYVRLEDTPGWKEYLDAQKDVQYETAESDKANNYETLQKRQVEFVNRSLASARKEGKLGWLFHVDSDELIEGDLAVLDRQPPEIKTITMQNVEAVYDGTEQTCFDAHKFLRCGDGKTKCRSYANGKSAGRVEDGVS